MTETDELCRLLDRAGVEWTRADDGTVRFNDSEHWFYVWTYSDGLMCVSMGYLTPEQAIAATVGRGTCGKVYLVETSDDLFEGWYPMTVYLHREAAEDCAKAFRKEEDGIWQFARVSELKVVDA